MKVKFEKVVVWKAMLKGDCKQIALSEGALWESLESEWWYDPVEKVQWHVISETLNVACAEGRQESWLRKIELFEDNDDSKLSEETAEKIKKVHWDCPICHGEHWCNVEFGEGNRGLWFCESGSREIVLVEF